MQLAEIPSWVWQLAGASGGVLIGLVLSAFRRDKRHLREQTRPPAVTSRPETELPSQPASQLAAAAAAADGPDSDLPPARPGAHETPQERLLARLTKVNKDLENQVRSAATAHSRLLKSKDEAVAATQADFELKLEELRQAHSSELKQLMALLLKEVERITKLREDHVAALEADLERLRGETIRHTLADYEQAQRQAPASSASASVSAYAPTEVMGLGRPTR